MKYFFKKLFNRDHACLNDSSVQQLKSIMNGKIDDCVDKQPEVVQIMKCQSGSSCYLYKSNSISTITSDVTLIISLYVIKLIFQWGCFKKTQRKKIVLNHSILNPNNEHMYEQIKKIMKKNQLILFTK